MTKSNMFQKMRASFLFAVSAFSASIAMDTSPKLLSENPKIAGIASLPRNVRSLIYSECRAKDLHTLSLTSRGMKKDIKEVSEKNQRIQAIVDDIIICNPDKDNLPLKTFISGVENALGLFSGLALMCEANDDTPYNDVEFEDLLSVVNNPQITKLSLVHMNISQEALENILCSTQYATHLKSLFLACQGLSDKMAIHLSKNKHLTYLGLSAYQIQENVENIMRQSKSIKPFEMITGYDSTLLCDYKYLDEKSPMTKFLNFINIITSLKNETFSGSFQERSEAISLLKRVESRIDTLPFTWFIDKYRDQMRSFAKTSVRTLLRKLDPGKQIFLKSFGGASFSVNIDKETKWSDIYDKIGIGFGQPLTLIFNQKLIPFNLEILPMETFYQVPKGYIVFLTVICRGD